MDLSIEVLLVDDLKNLRRLLKTILRKIGFKTIHEAANGLEALEILDANNIGLIISDWNMPKMSGIEFLSKVKTIDDYKSIPFLMITAEGTKDNIIAAINAGVTNYIVKPVNAEVVEEKIKLIFN